MPRDRILRNIARCKKCNTVLESVSVHDFRYCKCKSICVDGGLDYIKRAGDLDSIDEMSVYIKPSDKLDMKFGIGQLWIDDIGRVALLYDVHDSSVAGNVFCHGVSKDGTHLYTSKMLKQRIL